MNKKIIFIHKIVYPYGPYFSKDDPDNFFHFGLGRLILDNLDKPDRKVPCEFENWRMDPGINKIEERIVNGIKCRIFPAKNIKKIGAFSFSFLRALKKEYHENYVILHFTNSPHTWPLIVTSLYLKNYPIVVSHLGGFNPYYKYKTERKKLSYIKYLLERYTLKNIDKFFVSVIEEKDYFSKFIDKNNIYFGPIQGVENYFINEDPIPKNEARKRFNLPEKKKIILTVGRLEKEMGADENVKVFKRLKKEFNVMWLAVGTNERDNYYQEAKKAGVTLLPYIGREDGLKYYFYAADVYSYPMYHYDILKNFGGTGIATLEALFCNLPYVGNGIAHIPNNEGGKCGIVPNNTQELYQGIKKAFEHPEQFGNTREIVMKYYTWEKVLDTYLSIYEQLFEKYYS